MPSPQEIIGCLIDEDVFGDSRLPTLDELLFACGNGTLSESIDRGVLVGAILESSPSPIEAIKQHGETILRHLQSMDPSPEETAKSNEQGQLIVQKAGGAKALLKLALKKVGGGWASRIWNYVGSLFSEAYIDPMRGSERPDPQANRPFDPFRGSQPYARAQQIQSDDRAYWQQQEGKSATPFLLGLIGLMLAVLTPLAGLAMPIGAGGIVLLCGSIFRAMTR